jgi:CarboxypepD_reg-like domain/TonB-dependent Receptor Plug Domain
MGTCFRLNQTAYFRTPQFLAVFTVLASVLFAFLLHTDSIQAQTVSGTVSEKSTGEAVIGANVLVLGTSRGAATNAYGFFSIPDLEAGDYVLRISAIGYKTDTVSIALSKGESKRLAIMLNSVSIEFDEVVVEAEREPIETRTIGQMEMPMEQIFRIPSLGGEPDIFRALLLLPGVQSSSELSSGLHVRGGSPDQNLVLLDNIVMYNPYHLGGFLSTFNSDAINHVRLIKGTMPAKYGGRLSSVIDVTMKEGSKEKLHGSGGISMIDSRLTLEGPITEDMTFMVSGRRVYLDALTSLVSDAALPYYFYDLLAKTNYRIDDNNRLYLSGFFGRDILEAEDDEGQVDWGSTAFNLRWTHVFSSKLFSSVSLVYSDYSFKLEEEIYEYDYTSGDRVPVESFYSLSAVEDITLRGELEYFYSADHAITAGADLYLHSFTSKATEEIQNYIEMSSDLPTQRSTQFSLFVQDDWQVNERIKTNLGARLFYFDRGNYLRAEPRFSALYTFDEGTVLKAAITGANQFLHLVNRTDLALPFDMWFPSTSNLSPSFSMQYTLGATRTFFTDYILSVEAYYKSMERILAFKDDAVFSSFIPLEGELTSGEGSGYGFEVMFQRKVGALTGWLAYTLSWADRSFTELNHGKSFPPRYDKRHDISLVLNYRLGDSWEFTAVWVYATGQAMTFPIAQYTIDAQYGSSSYKHYPYLYTDRNGYRLPSYHRLDLNFSHSFSWFGWAWKVHLNVYNTYNRMNPFTQYITNKWDPATGKSTKAIKQTTILPVVPTAGLSFRF